MEKGVDWGYLLLSVHPFGWFYGPPSFWFFLCLGICGMGEESLDFDAFFSFFDVLLERTSVWLGTHPLGLGVCSPIAVALV